MNHALYYYHHYFIDVIYRYLELLIIPEANLFLITKQTRQQVAATNYGCMYYCSDA